MIKIFLRELERNDLAQLNIWRNDPEVIRLLGANFLYIGADVDERWFESYLGSRALAVRLAIVVSDISSFIGTVNLTNIHVINQAAEFSVMIGDKNYWSQGVGKQATYQMLYHGFNNLNLHRIHLTVLSSYTRARSLYKQLGFLEEGVQREAVYKDGHFCDVVSMALLKSDFQNIK